MLFWKEWRETRFGYLTILFFMTGLYVTMPMDRILIESYWIAVFQTFFAMAIAIVMGSSALAPEVGSDTIVFLLSKPVGRAKYLTTKYLVRGGEALSIVAIPFSVNVLRDWEGHSEWLWCPPYLSAQWILGIWGGVVLAYSGAFFFSVLFKRQTLAALAGIAFLAGHLVWRGVGSFQKVLNYETLEIDILIQVLLIAAIFGGSLIAFRVREF